MSDKKGKLRDVVIIAMLILFFGGFGVWCVVSYVLTALER